VIFVDTGAWFAAFVPNDADHAAADAWLEANREPLVTTDYVIDELLTLMKMRGEFQRACRLGASLFAEEIAQVEWVQPDDIRQAWAIFQRYDDKGWSFTDCVSRVVMARLSIQQAFAFDEHFRQFGTVTVVPSIHYAT
jgi:predicted nucleic acid-binding protein